MDNSAKYRRVMEWEEVEDGFKSLDEYDVILHEFLYTRPLCEQIVIDLLEFAGLATEGSKVEIGEFDDFTAKCFNELSLTFLSFCPTVDGVDVGKRIKCCIRYGSFVFSAQGGFICNSDGTGKVDFFAYNDWDDPMNPVLIHTGSADQSDFASIETAGDIGVEIC